MGPEARAAAPALAEGLGGAVVRDALAAIGSAAVPALVELLTDPDQAVALRL